MTRRAKLSPQRAAKVRALVQLRRLLTRAAIARAAGVSPATVDNYVSGRTASARDVPEWPGLREWAKRQLDELAP